MTTTTDLDLSGVLAARHRAAILAGSEVAHDRLSWTRPQIREHQQTHLRALIASAIERSPFHRERLAGVDPATFTVDRLRELPVMTKAEMMRDFDRVVTDPRLDLPTVEAHLATLREHPRYLHDEYLVMASGGSSGERGVFVYDTHAFTEFAHSITRVTNAKLRALGVGPDHPLPAAVVGAGATLHGTGIVSALLGQGESPLAITAVPAALPFGEIVTTLRSVQPVVLVGYPSVLVRLAAARAAGELDIAPMAVSATSEPMPREMRQQIERGFGVPVANTFASTEGLVGLAAPGEDAIQFAEDTCIVELVDTQHRPVAPGELADHVLVTNLANTTQPLIRYVLGDRMQEVGGAWPDGHLRALVDGRNDPPLRWGSVSVHPLVLRAVLVTTPEVHEYQVRQRTWGVEVDVVGTACVDTDALADRLGDALRAVGLPGSAARVAQVAAIARDPATGKARRFVPLG